ncbi:MAG: 16S rRNA (uracil(1498)-N(3))-methyltransferase [Candidatus Omnitrophica bacterium]|nr:16S rRNA (uracil(1498)-N(3))-methyltransferase [Candidatus Omnitrophota bacterium]MBU1127490.1 16S rRNA (uracil(1498)-N(3))-methyltransferase [Candidatus Omnitrophota bacterium]MBU1656649.1 16S rRNA (uracil(1498)-N(3))-methyltransferase [Candidatus Omnitrophota bacterium]MBU1785114.1 16S rRNA (uracil(1498)-N(3))-methyltransferase [Candidatus Omnitrophota bacterium]MBU1851507.1 16S rRNA (uracil(1498)-N(3))-methyltransferase [Candidatus Omnitrophota bacterium]
MSRFYVPPENVHIKRKEIEVPAEESHHIIDVMRMRESDKVVVFDGTGNEYTGFIEQIDNRTKGLTIRIIKTDTPSIGKVPEVHLAQAIPKQNRMDYIIEKATELGVSRVIPFISDRTIVRPAAASAERKKLRWKAIAKEASKQCGRRRSPEISGITGVKDVLDTCDEYDLVLFAWLSEETRPIRTSLEGFKTGKVLVLIGPEEDFTPKEASNAVMDNCKFISLGKRVLKSDTAGLFVLSVLSYEFSI